MRVPVRTLTVLALAATALGCHSAEPTTARAVARARPAEAPPPPTADPASADEAAAEDLPAEDEATAAPADPDAEQELDPGAPGDFDDGYEAPVVGGEVRPHPLAKLSDDEVAERVHSDLASLGSMSIGRPSAGRLLNGVHMPEGPAWRLVDPPHTWGTQETVDALKTAINAVFDRFPDTPPLPIGHISAEHGGHLRPHISHQSGRDVDLGYYYREDDSWYRRAHAGNLDLERTWSLVRAFVTQTDVEMILIDRSIQRLLRDHAEKIGEPKAWLDDLFAGKGPRGPLIRHARGHSTHLHVRFFSPTAQETARRCIPALVEEGVIEAPPHFVYHRVRKGETLGKLAKRYGTTVRAIMRANGLRRTLIQARKTYRIPRPGLPPGLKEPVRIPGRRLPGG